MITERHTAVPELPCSKILQKTFYMDAFFVQLLRQGFSNPDMLPKGLQHLKWQPGSGSGQPLDTPRGIEIYNWTNWNPANRQNLPALIVRSGDVGFVKLGIANRHVGMQPGDHSGQQYYTKAVVSSHRVFCLARKPDEALLLGLFVGDHLQAFSQEIANGMGLNACEVQSVNTPKRLRELPHSFASPVTIEYGFFYSWSVTPAAPRLNNVEFELGKSH